MAEIGLIGPKVDLTYDYKHLGNSPRLIDDLLSGKNKFSTTLKKARFPMLILGSGALARDDGAAILNKARLLSERFQMLKTDWNGFNVLQRAASRVGGLDLGFRPKQESDLGFLSGLKISASTKVHRSDGRLMVETITGALSGDGLQGSFSGNMHNPRSPILTSATLSVTVDDLARWAPGVRQEPQTPLPTVPSLPGLPDSSGLPPLPATVGPTHPAAPAPVLPSNSLGLPSVPTAPPLIAATSTEHIVASGENFWTIGKKYDVSAKSIEGANPTVIPTRMKIGQKIIIPAKPVVDPSPAPPVVNDGSTYTVKSGDTLGHIAQRHKVKLNDLKSANPNVVPTRMKIGQQLKMPTGATVSPPAVVPSLSVLPDATTSPPVDPITGLPLLPAANR